MNLLRGFLDNDSAFGQIMTRCWIIIACNVLFVLLTLPVVTTGAAWVAMDYVFLRTLRGESDLNPLRVFWRGLRMNFKQASLCWIVILLLLCFLGLEIYWCGQFGGIFQIFRLGLVMLASAVVILTLYLFPVMAAFRGTLPALLRHSLYFAFHKPLNLIIIVFFHVFPLFLTYSDLQNLPLYAFLWCFIGFGAVEMLTAALLSREFAPYLSAVDEYGNPVTETEQGHVEKSEAEILEDMRKLDM
ncbi:MAG: DUF624 domain-containing protein [Oscillospiraceae bacterium]|nr:DUF624 domain-containing protein [Oscillospiraceae bacterium]